MKLEYLLTFTNEGIPIHSSCYGTFCANMGYNKSLLSGFISAISTMPSAVGHDDSVKTVEMGYSKMYFHQTHPSKHIITLGVIKETLEEPDSSRTIDAIFEQVEKILEEEFGSQTWEIVSSEDRKRLDEMIIHQVIQDQLPTFVDNDVCDHDNCPFDSIADHSHDESLSSKKEKAPLKVWDKVSWVYENKTTPFLKKLLAPIMVPIFRYFDVRGYRKREKQVSSRTR